MLITKSHNKFAIFLILISLLAIIVVACGPAESDPGDPEAADSVETPENSEPNAGAIEAEEAEESDNGLEVAPNSIETDSKGLTVGFTEDGHAFRGDPAAPVVIEEFSDFQCPYCARFISQTAPALEDNQIANGEAVLVYYDFPLNSIHPQANAAANAARCAGEQGAAAFWDMHDQLFNTVNSWSNNQANTVFVELAGQIGLDSEAFNACLEEAPHQQAIREDLNNGASFGITGTPSFLINGQLMVGAQPLAVFENAIAAAGEGRPIAGASNGNATGAAQPSQQPAVAPTPATFTEDFAAAMGDPEAPVTIVEFTDYQCPYCSQHSTQTMPQVIRDMVDTGRVYYILKDFPLDQIHPNARIGAIAARCAGDQDAYWEMHDLLFSQQSAWSDNGEEAAIAALVELAESTELDSQEFAACLESGRYNNAVETNLQEGRSLGVSGTPHFFVDGYPLNGARPFEHFELAVGLAEDDRLAEAFEQPAQQQPTPQAPQQEYPVDVVLGDAYRIGDPDAPITMVEFTDFQCPYCSRHFQQTYPQILEEYVETGMVQYVIKDFPLKSIHPQAAKAAEAARCAGDQNAYLEMHDILFERQSEWGVSNPVPVFAEYAGELGLNSEEFTQCLESNKHQAAVDADLQQGIELGVTGTPAFFMNGYPLSGAQPFNVFQQGVTTLLANIEGEEQ